MPPEVDRGRWLKLALGIALSVVLIWLAFRDTPFAEVWSQITEMRVAPMTLAVFVATLPFLLRVPRWSILLRREDGSSLPNRSLWHSIAIGFAANNVLPFRLGEVARMGAISRLENVPFASAFSSVAVERVIDAIVAVALFATALLVTDLGGAAEAAEKARLVGVLATALLLFAIAVARWPVLAIGPISTLAPKGRIRDTLLGVIGRLVAGLTALSEPHRAGPVLLWSLVVWLVNAAAFWVGFKAFGIAVPFTGALILQGMLLIGIAIPSSPGYVGVFEGAIVVTLVNFFGIRTDIALAYAITYHVTTFVPITLLGVYSLLATGLTVKSAAAAAE